MPEPSLRSTALAQGIEAYEAMWCATPGALGSGRYEQSAVRHGVDAAFRVIHTQRDAISGALYETTNGVPGRSVFTDRQADAVLATLGADVP